MKYKRTIQQVRVLAVLLCLAAFLVLNSIVHVQIRHYKNEEQLAATYTAEATARRIEAQLNRYLSRSDLLKNIIESGVDIDESSYDDLYRYMLNSDGIIQAIELAPDGVVEQVYPLANNEQAVGLDLIHDEERGKNTTLAKNSGRQAIDLFEQSAPGGYDAILMDVMMPNVAGSTAARIIRALDRPDAETVPILALTANAFAEDARKCLDAGMNAYLAKPLNMPLVKATIAKFAQHSTTV